MGEERTGGVAGRDGRGGSAVVGRQGEADVARWLRSIVPFRDQPYFRFFLLHLSPEFTLLLSFSTVNVLKCSVSFQTYKS